MNVKLCLLVVVIISTFSVSCDLLPQYLILGVNPLTLLSGGYDIEGFFYLEFCDVNIFLRLIQVVLGIWDLLLGFATSTKIVLFLSSLNLKMLMKNETL
jgi:4-amino-4-deoxy-L-arabinose transferase-like glycosyltransferase